MPPTLSHFTSPDYWRLYHQLSVKVQKTADKYFGLLVSDTRHPSLHFKKIGDLWSVRAGIHYRALGMNVSSKEKGILWFWIGSHAEYDHLIKKR